MGLTLTMGYDPGDRLTSVGDSLGGTLTNLYDTANRLTGRKFSDTGGHTLSTGYAYNDADQVTTDTRYSDATQTTSVGTTAYIHDNAGRVTEIAHKNAGGTNLDTIDYSYDMSGRVATETSTLGPSKTDTYDKAGQLLSDGTNNYGWDAEGNSTKSGYTTTTGNELSTDGTWNYSYDAAGNETQKVNIADGKVWQYGYDNANHLVEADHKPSLGGAVDERIDFKYDVTGNRIEKDIDPTGGGTFTTKLRMAYDPSGNAWADLNGLQSNALEARRIYGNGLDALIAKIAAGATTWYLGDILGSARDFAASNGSLIDHRDWDSFGKLTNETQPANGDRYAWTGRETDVEIGLQYNRARYYDPATQRWMSQDPLGFDAGDSNLYRYANNRPQTDRDPSGLDPPETYEQYVIRMSQRKNTGAGPLSPILSEPLWRSKQIDIKYYNERLPQVVIDPSVIAPAAKPFVYDPAAAKQYHDDPNQNTQIGITGPWQSGMKANNDGLYTFVVVASIVIPGWQAGTLILIPIDIAEGNPGAALGNALPGMMMLGKLGTAGEVVSGGLGGPRAANTGTTFRASTGGTGSGLGMPNVPWTYGNLPASMYGRTDRFGNITIQQGLSGSKLVEIVRHESIHRLLSPGPGALQGARGNALVWGYQNSQLLRFLEEAAAQTYATGSLRQGLAYPLNGAYNLSVNRIAFEGGAYIFVVGGSSYGAYRLSK